MGQVPFTKVAGIPPEAQRQLQRNFEAAVKTLAEGGGRVKVPFTKIAGLPPEAQRQIQRNFEDLVGGGAGGIPTNTVPPGTVLTSDEFTTGAGGALLTATSTDIFAGGTALPWQLGFANGPVIHRDAGWPFGEGHAAYLTGSSGAAVDIVDTGQASVEARTFVTDGFIGAIGYSGSIIRWVDDQNYIYGYHYGTGAGGGFNYAAVYGKVVGGVDTPYHAVVPIASTPVVVKLAADGFYITFTLESSGGTVLFTDTVGDTLCPIGTKQGIYMAMSGSAGGLVDHFIATAV